MADRDLIRQLLIETSGSVRKGIKPDEVDAAADRLARSFGQITNAVFARMYDAWFDSLGEKTPDALPTGRQLWAIENRAIRQTERETGPRVSQRPRREFVEAQKEFRAALPRLGKTMDDAGRDGRHEHTTPTHVDGVRVTTGREDCNACKKVDARRAIIAAALEKLPVPVESGSWRCRCDGSGWRDEVPDWRDLPEDGPRLPLWVDVMEFEAEDRMVYPCSKCLPGAFDGFLKGELV